MFTGKITKRSIFFFIVPKSLESLHPWNKASNQPTEDHKLTHTEKGKISSIKWQDDDGQTTKLEFCLGGFVTLVWRKCLGSWRMFLPSAHNALSVRWFMTSQVTTHFHRPYCTYWAPCDYFGSPWWKVPQNPFGGTFDGHKWLADLELVKPTSQKVLEDTKLEFQMCIKQCKKQLHQCHAPDGGTLKRIDVSFWQILLKILKSLFLALFLCIACRQCSPKSLTKQASEPFASSWSIA